MSKGVQNGISHFEKKIKPSSPISFHSFGNLKEVCKKFLFHGDAIALAAYAEQLLPRGKAAVCCILPHGIVWMHLKVDNKEAISNAVTDNDIFTLHVYKDWTFRMTMVVM